MNARDPGGMRSAAMPGDAFAEGDAGPISANPTLSRVARFVLDPAPEIPDSALAMASALLVDSVGVAAGAADLEAAQIAREVALTLYGSGDPAGGARLMFDGRRASIAGAAFAGATQIDNLDAHDGLNPTKGHIGCAVVPSLFAFAETCPALSGRDALRALVIAYEVAARAGIALHGTVTDYHTSGAWNALGVAALGCRLLGAGERALRHALGIAEYHGPRSQMMREIDHPSMLHDGSGVGALTGVSAVVMALRGFHASPAITVEAQEVASTWQDLGRAWSIEDNYIKPYPVCRWAHAAIDAVAMLCRQHAVDWKQVARVRIRTFGEAARLFPGMPATTSQAQYSLAFPVAVILRHGRIGPEHVSGPGLAEPEIAQLLKRVNVSEDARHSGRFPRGRWSDVSITLDDGRRLDSGDVHARGGPEAPLCDDELARKLESFVAPSFGSHRARQILETGHRLVEEQRSFSSLAELVLRGR